MTTSYGKPSILVVDDDTATAELLVELLSDEAGYCVRSARAAYQALEIIHTGRVDLLVLDVMMPDLSGADLYELLQEDASTRGIPVFFITAGRGGEQLASRTGKLVLEKPFDLDTFLSAVRTTLGGASQGWNTDLSGLASP